MRIHPAVHEILADKAFTATDVLISQSFVVAFVHPTYVQIALIWGFPTQLGLGKLVHWLWRYKLNEVYDTKSNGMDMIVAIVDRFMKMIQLKATTMSISSEGIAKIYRDNIWKLHEVPKRILSDQGLQFASKFMGELIKVLGTIRQLLMAYHPQTDSQTERIDQEIRMFLRHYVNYQQDNWTEWLAATEFQYNDKRHAATGRTPFELNFGKHPWKGDLCQVHKW